jgi:hypothetical protein
MKNSSPNHCGNADTFGGTIRHEKEKIRNVIKFLESGCRWRRPKHPAKLAVSYLWSCIQQAFFTLEEGSRRLSQHITHFPPGGKPRQRFERFEKKCRFRHSEKWS